jgi:hypothetical protein
MEASMTLYEAHSKIPSTQQNGGASGATPDGRISLNGRGRLSFKADETTLEFCYQAGEGIDIRAATVRLPVPSLDAVTDAALDPSLKRVIARIAPYPGMACGDKLLLHWEGLDIDGFTYHHEVSRFISEEQVGKDVVFVIKGVHVAALDGGSLEIYWTLYSATCAEPAVSERVQMDVGDVRTHLLAPRVDDTVGGVLDPERFPDGARVSLQPYARMAEGDRVLLSWQGAPNNGFDDALTVAAYAVGEALSFWLPPECFVAHLGSEAIVRYRVESKGGEARDSESAKVVIASLIRGRLAAPDVLEAQDGILDIADSTDGITVVIGNAQAQAGELVYLKCDGDFFNHRDDREITRDSAGQPLVFIVPHRFWREHQGSTVRIAYSVERTDDVSQVSEVTQVHVE